MHQTRPVRRLRALALGISLMAGATAAHGAQQQPAPPAQVGHEHAGHAQATGGHGEHAGHEQATSGHGEHAAGGHDHSKHDHSASASAADAVSATDVDLRDRTLVDADGRERKFVSDVIGDHIVVMDFVFTNCTNVCPVLSAVLGQVRHTLGEQVGKEIVLVSVSVDPVRDTPQRLKSYSKKYGLTEGWLWLTGPKTQVEDVLIGLGAYSVNFEDHPSMVLVGDARTGQWSRFFGFPSPKRIVEQVEKLQAARKATAGGS